MRPQSVRARISSAFDVSLKAPFRLHCPALKRARHQSTLPRNPDAAPDLEKSLELETRIGRVELTLDDLCDRMIVMERRTAAIQAELHHFLARLARS